MKVVILAGGSGSRLWPLSRQKRPKQLCNIISDRPMLVDTYERLLGEFNSEDIFFSTIPEFQEEISKMFPHVSRDRIIIEPARRDTGPAMGYAAAYLFRKYPDEPMAFVPADHYIAQPDLLLSSMRAAERLIRKTGKMLDIGIHPNFPSTVMGYTRIGPRIETEESVDVYEFRGHNEKPDYDTAKAYLDQGDYLWHGSYYMWTPRKFLQAYERYAPHAYECLERIMRLWDSGQADGINAEYEKMEKISIDYAVTEKMDPSDVLIIKGDFGWSDIGAWDTLYDKMSQEHDENGNLFRGDVLAIDSKNCLIHGRPGKTIAAIGLSDMVVVDTEDALLICPKGKAQEVKKIVERLKEQGRDDVL